MAVRVRQPLPAYRAVPLSHEEFKRNDDGNVEVVKVDDCGFLCDAEDYDLEVLQRSGTNLKEVNTLLFQRSVAYPKVTDDNKEQNNDDKKEN